MDLYNVGMRQYDYHTGRFTTPDPIGLAGGLNRYAYVDDDPINGVDPSGLFINYIAGGVSNVAIGWTFAKLTGQCYTWKNAAFYAATGALGVGLLSKTSEIMKATRSAELFWHGPADMILKTGKQWATTREIFSPTAFEIGGKWGIKGLNVFAKDLRFVHQIPNPELFSPEYNMDIFAWWKGVLRQYSYTPGGVSLFRQAGETFISVFGSHAITDIIITEYENNQDQQ